MTLAQSYALWGPEELEDLELLTLAIGDNATVEATSLLLTFGTMRGVATAEVGALQKAGMCETSATRLHASLRLARRALRDRTPRIEVVTSSDEAYAHFQPAMQGLVHEELHALYLDRRRHPVGLRRLTQGSDQFTVVDCRQIFQIGISMGASAVVLAHNHPSGDPNPSTQDYEVTRRVAQAGRVIGITLLDHLVIGHGQFVSMAQTGQIELRGGPSSDWIS